MLGDRLPELLLLGGTRNQNAEHVLLALLSGVGRFGHADGVGDVASKHEALLLRLVGDREEGLARKAVVHLDEIHAELLQEVDLLPSLGLGPDLGPALPWRGRSLEDHPGQHQTRTDDGSGRDRLTPLEILPVRHITEVVGDPLIAHVANTGDAVDDVAPEAVERQ